MMGGLKERRCRKITDYLPTYILIPSHLLKTAHPRLSDLSTPGPTVKTCGLELGVHATEGWEAGRLPTWVIRSRIPVPVPCEEDTHVVIPRSTPNLCRCY